MEMNALKPDSHVAQQSRRERLRIQHHFQELHNNNLEWPTAVNYPAQNPDRNVRNITNFVYDPSLISSDMINFLTNSQRDASFIVTTQDSHQQSNDWMLNYAIGDGRSQNPMIASGVMMPKNSVNDNDMLMHQSSSWGSHDWNEHGVDLPNFGNQSSELINFDAIRSIEADPNTQRLSLSLSHNSHFNGAYESHDSIPKPSIISRGTSGKSINETVGITNPTYRCTGPLGPFTGYATILKCSKFLMPAQELLDEFCSSKSFDHRRVLLSGEVCSNSLSGLGVSKSRVVITKVDEVSVVSSSTYHSSNEVTGDCGIGCSNSDSCRPDYQQTKAKLICLQEEVCRKYKQYHQQMQMVVSSFESVSGLRAASPYISMAIKSLSRNFRGLKNAILDQLRHIGKALGEDLLSTGAASSSDVGNFKYTNKISGFQDKKFGGGPTGNVGIMEPQCVWRSQRGLPERSVAVLRAWLFEHFLHPYPTDTDKHMLAAQTGLTRNQVSNWFINARVRIWKPMVEEIHNLENSRATESNKNSHNLTDEKPTAEGTSRNIKFNATSEKQLEEQLEVPEIGILGNIGSHNLGMEQWNRGKHGGDCELPASVLDSNSLMGFVPYHHQRSHGLEIGGIGAVSLTLELRHGVENGQQQAQLLQHEDQLRNQFHFVDRLN